MSDKGRELHQQVDPTKLMNDFFAAITFLMADRSNTGKVGITAFVMGVASPMLRQWPIPARSADLSDFHSNLLIEIKIFSLHY
ncbi:hypothetical protein yrohd0001_8520 [Yersinia rohdei ATCC 43380]|nr:hypothetical protein yrohd0001_8520 [Yersinia rohdei ATCC 43380]